MATRRKYLGSRQNYKVMIDMEEVYRLIDKGMTVKDVAAHLGVSRTTLYDRHRKYQASLETLGADGDDIFNEMNLIDS